VNKVDLTVVIQLWSLNLYIIENTGNFNAFTGLLCIQLLSIMKTTHLDALQNTVRFSVFFEHSLSITAVCKTANQNIIQSYTHD